MQKVFDGIFKFFENLSAVLLFILTAAAFYQLVSRYAFHSANAGVDELVRLAFVWVISFGSALAFRAKAHLGVTALLNKSKGNIKRYWQIGINLMMLVFMVFVVAAGTQMARMGMKQYSEYLRMSMFYFYACIPAGGVLCIISFIEDIYQIVRKIQDPGSATEDEDADLGTGLPQGG